MIVSYVCNLGIAIDINCLSVRSVISYIIHLVSYMKTNIVIPKVSIYLQLYKMVSELIIYKVLKNIT